MVGKRHAFQNMALHNFMLCAVIQLNTSLVLGCVDTDHGDYSVVTLWSALAEICKLHSMLHA